MMKQFSGLLIGLCVMNFDFVKLQPHTKLYDYVMRDGLNVHVFIGIDFSGSDPKGKSSHLSANVKENYTRAMNAMAKILAHYDSDKIFLIYGYGANSGALFGDKDYPTLIALEAYPHLIDQVKKPASPNLEPAIRHTMSVARKYPVGGNNYAVLVLLTDGRVADKEATIAAIVEASELPMSIIAVGVGDHDSEIMELFDANKTPLEANGKRAKRNIVQFIPFKTFRTVQLKPMVGDVLKELPDQIGGWLQAVKS